MISQFFNTNRISFCRREDNVKKEREVGELETTNQKFDDELIDIEDICKTLEEELIIKTQLSSDKQLKFTDLKNENKHLESSNKINQEIDECEQNNEAIKKGLREKLTS